MHCHSPALRMPAGCLPSPPHSAQPPNPTPFGIAFCLLIIVKSFLVQRVDPICCLVNSVLRRTFISINAIIQFLSKMAARFPEVAELPLPKSRFSEVAELINVCWLEIRGKINTDMLSPSTKYAAYLVFICKSTGAYGFDFLRAEGSVSVSEHESEKRSICLDPEGEQRQSYQIVPRHRGLFYHRVAYIQRQHPQNAATNRNTQYPKKRDDGWMEVELGEYFVQEGQDGDLEASLMEVQGGNWKSGIIIQGIEIRPKECE